MCINLRLVTDYLYVFGMQFPLIFAFAFFHQSFCYIAFSTGNVSQLHFCVEISQQAFLWVFVLFVLFGFFFKFLVCFSLVLFCVFLPALDTACLVLFRLIVLAVILLPSLLEGKGLGLIFPLKESSWALAKPLETKWWGEAAVGIPSMDKFQGWLFLLLTSYSYSQASSARD